VPFEAEKLLLPEYPRTRHLPWKPNASRDDLIASEKECRIIFESQYVCVEEKVDGANVGMTRGPEGPIIRNRNHILRKGYSAKTAAKLQFTPIWNWYYEHIHCFDALEQLAGPVSVFGEWLLALHSVAYDKLPAYFLAFDLYNYDEGKFLDPVEGKTILTLAGFCTVPELYRGAVQSYEQLEKLAYSPSPFSTKVAREGVYVKVSDGEWITHRFKMVRHGFIAGEHFSTRGSITKNKLQRAV
jgi:atypical dual specificity phosphatase